MEKAWYVFMSGDDPMDPKGYYKITVQHNCLCGNKICTILAKSTEGNYPASPLSENIQKYIQNALSTGELQPKYPFEAKKYVYLKDT